MGHYVFWLHSCILNEENGEVMIMNPASDYVGVTLYIRYRKYEYTVHTNFLMFKIVKFSLKETRYQQDLIYLK